MRDGLDMCNSSGQSNIARRQVCAVRRTAEDEVHGEASIEVDSSVDLVDFFWRHRNVEGFDISHQVLHTPLADNWEDIWSLVH